MLEFDGGSTDVNDRLANIFLSAEVSERDKAFHDDITAGEGEWWTSDEGEYLGFEYLGWLVTKRVNEVCCTL
jgi:hypothetical protein